MDAILGVASVHLLDCYLIATWLLFGLSALFYIQHTVEKAGCCPGSRWHVSTHVLHMCLIWLSTAPEKLGNIRTKCRSVVWFQDFPGREGWQAYKAAHFSGFSGKLIVFASRTAHWDIAPTLTWCKRGATRGKFKGIDTCTKVMWHMLHDSYITLWSNHGTCSPSYLGCFGTTLEPEILWVRSCGLTRNEI